MAHPYQHHLFPGADYSFFSSRDRAQLAQPELYDSVGVPKADSEHIIAGIQHYTQHYSEVDRQRLRSAIEAQLPEEMRSHDQLTDQLQRLTDENTYCVVTAHQPCLMTGPLYVLYKIASAIGLAKSLSEQHADLHFVPVYVMGSEDHDLDEMNHLHLFGERLTWAAEKTGGAIGRMLLGTEIEAVLQAVDEKLQREQHHGWLMDHLRAAYQPQHTVAFAISHFIYSLYADHGLLVLGPDDKTLKEASKALFHRELTEHASEALVQDMQSAIAEELDQKSQVYARATNLFYLDQERTYIEAEGEHYMVGDTSYTLEDLLAHPERLSPNVILRPLYQQHILPAVAFIGGGAEVAYWAELHRVFHKYGVWYPAVYRRDSAAILAERPYQQWLEADLKLEDFLQPFDQIEASYIEAHSDVSWHLDDEIVALMKVYEEIKTKALQVDKGIEKQVDKFAHATEKQVKQLEQRLRKHIKSQKEVELNRLRRIHGHLHPKGKAQERYDSPLSYLARHGEDFVAMLVAHFDPSQRALHIFTGSR